MVVPPYHAHLVIFEGGLYNGLMDKKSERVPILLPDIQGKTPPWKISYLDWLDKHGFFMRDTWDEVNNKMVGAGWLSLQPHQKRILGHALNFDSKTGTFPWSTVLYSAIKKSGKTSVAASIGCWYAEVAPPGTEIYVIANDLESAEGRIMRDIKFHADRRGWRKKNYFVELPNETFIQALAQSYRTVAGSRHGLTLWDEIWGISHELTRRTFEELTPIPTIPWSLRFIATYAGFHNESDLLWEMYLHGVGIDEHEEGQGKPYLPLADLPVWTNGAQFTYWDHIPRMPWQTQNYYSQQRADNRPAAYLRLHENRWVSSNELFIPEEWWDAASRYAAPPMMEPENELTKLPVYIAVDAAPLRDCTALTATVFNTHTGEVSDIYHKIWTPDQDGDYLDFDETLGPELEMLKKKFNIALIGYDPAHLYQFMGKLGRKNYPIYEISQAAGGIMVKATQTFYDLLRYHKFFTYKDPEAKAHIMNTVTKSDGKGFRIIKGSRSSKAHKPIDYAVSTIMSTFLATESGGIDVTIPVVIASPFSDMTAWGKSQQHPVPWQFQE